MGLKAELILLSIVFLLSRVETTDVKSTSTQPVTKNSPTVTKSTAKTTSGLAVQSNPEVTPVLTPKHPDGKTTVTQPSTAKVSNSSPQPVQTKSSTSKPDNITKEDTKAPPKSTGTTSSSSNLNNTVTSKKNNSVTPQPPDTQQPAPNTTVTSLKPVTMPTTKESTTKTTVLSISKTTDTKLNKTGSSVATLQPNTTSAVTQQKTSKGQASTQGTTIAAVTTKNATETPITTMNVTETPTTTTNATKTPTTITNATKTPTTITNATKAPTTTTNATVTPTTTTNATVTPTTTTNATKTPTTSTNATETPTTTTNATETPTTTTNATKTPTTTTNATETPTTTTNATVTPTTNATETTTTNATETPVNTQNTTSGGVSTRSTITTRNTSETTSSTKRTSTVRPIRDEFVYINEIMVDKRGGFQKIELQLSKQFDLGNYAMVMVDGKTYKKMTVVYLKDMVKQKNDLLTASFNSTTLPSMIDEGIGVAIYDTREISLTNDWTFSESGLVDALVIGKYYTRVSEHLMEILTPGVNPFILDPDKYGISKTISRCSSDELRSTDMFALINPSFGIDNKQKCEERLTASSVFAFKIKDIDCRMLVHNGTPGLHDMTLKKLLHFIVKKMSRECQCGVTRMHIVDPKINCCDGTSIDLRFVAPNKDQLEELENSYTKFLANTTTINVTDHQFPIDNTCTKHCCGEHKVPTPQKSDDTAKNVRVTVAVIVSCLIVFMIVVVIVILYMRKKKSAVYQFRMSRLQEEEDDFMIDGPDQDDFVGGQEATFDTITR